MRDFSCRHCRSNAYIEAALYRTRKENDALKAELTHVKHQRDYMQDHPKFTYIYPEDSHTVELERERNGLKVQLEHADKRISELKAANDELQCRLEDFHEARATLRRLLS